MKQRIAEHFPDDRAISIHVEDVVEGSVECFLDAVVGGVYGDILEVYKIGVSAVFTINRMSEDLSISRYKSRENLSDTMDDILRVLKIKG